MGFFNKKEDVMDFKLTEYGKHLLANGKLKPVYYAFFDDDIQYDVSSSGYTEIQNNARKRIQNDTPRLKAIPTRKDAETRVNESLNILQTAIGNTNSDPAENVAAFKQQQPFADKGKLAASPIGRSSLNSKYNPAWNLQVLSNPNILTSSARYWDNEGYIENIPQININIDYETFFEEGDFTSEAISTYYPNTNFFISLKSNYLMMEIIEENTDFEKENYDIQVFLSQSTATGDFIAKSYLKDNPTQFVAPNTKNVEYYMNILVDNEIPREVIEELGISEKALFTSAERMNLNRNLYHHGDAAIPSPPPTPGAATAAATPGADDGQNEEPC